MLKTFNCGVGFCLIINPKNLKKVKSFFPKKYKPYVIGKIIKMLIRLNLMTKLIGLKKFKTAVFISGTGSNLKNLIKFSLLKKSPIKITLVISSNKKAKGLKFSKKFKIKSNIFNFSKKKELKLKYLKS